MSIIRANSAMKMAIEMALLAKIDPKMTPFAKMTPNRSSRFDVSR
jgi:hypothetical protein